MFPIFPVDYPFIERGTLLSWTRTAAQHQRLVKSARKRSSRETYFRRYDSYNDAVRRFVFDLRSASGFWASSRPGAPNRSPAKVSPTQVATASNAGSNDAQQLLAAGQAAQDQGRFEEAIRTYNRVIALSSNQPRTAAIANFRIGNAYMAQGKFGNAEVAFARAVALNPADAESYNNLGEALGELKQYPRALEAFTKAINLDQKLLKAKYNQAVSYDRMRQLSLLRIRVSKSNQNQSAIFARFRWSRRYAF